MLLPNQHFLLLAKTNGNTKEGTGKSMKNAFYILQCTQKAPFSLEVTLNREKSSQPLLSLKTSGS